jgi:hypothetical protein
MDISLSTNISTIRSVINSDVDEHKIKLFVHNSQKDSEKFENYFIVTEDSILIEEDHSFALKAASLTEAVYHVSLDPDECSSILKPCIEQIFTRDGSASLVDINKTLS